MKYFNKTFIFVLFLIFGVFLNCALPQKNSDLYSHINYAQKGLSDFFEGNLEDSYKTFLAGANENDKDATFILGMIYFDADLMGKRDLVLSEKWLKKASQLGSAEAAYNLAYFYLNGDFPNGDKSLIDKYVEFAKNQNYSKAYLFVYKNQVEYYNRFEKNFKLEEFYQDIKKSYLIESKPETTFLFAKYLYELWIHQNLDGNKKHFDEYVNIQSIIELFEKSFKTNIVIASAFLMEIYNPYIENDQANIEQYKFLSSYVKDYYKDPSVDLIEIEIKKIEKFSTASIFEVLTQEEKEVFVNKLKIESEYNGTSAYYLANLYSLGIVNNIQDEINAESYYNKSFQLGQQRAIYPLSKDIDIDIKKRDRLSTFFHDAADNKSPYALYIMANIYYQFSKESDKATKALLQSAKLGEVHAIKKLYELFIVNNSLNSGYDVVVSVSHAIYWLHIYIEMIPEDLEARIILIRLYNEMDSQKYGDEHFREISFLENLHLEKKSELTNIELMALATIAEFYSLDGEHQDSLKAYNMYKILLKKIPTEMVEYLQYAQFKFALLLKYGGNNLKPDEKAGLEHLLLLQDTVKQQNNTSINYELADIYHYGKGVDIDIEKAISLYKKGGVESYKALGKLLLESTHIEKQKEGIGFLRKDLVNSLLLKKYDDEVAEKILKNAHLPGSPTYIYEDIYMSKHHSLRFAGQAYSILKEGNDNQQSEMQLNYAKLLYSYGSPSNQQNTDEANKIIDELIAINYIPALKIKISWLEDKSKKIELLEKIIGLTNDDKDRLDLIRLYIDLSQYDLAEKIINSMQKDRIDGLKYYEKIILEEKAEIKMLKEKAIRHDSKAMYDLAIIYKKQGNMEDMRALLKQSADLNYPYAQTEYADYLLKNNSEPEATSLAKNYLIKRAERSDSEYDALQVYKLYRDNIDPYMTREEARRWGTEEEFFNFDQAYDVTNSCASTKAQLKEAFNILAESYKKGKGIKLNYEKAIEYYQKRAELGGYDSYISIANIYYQLNNRLEAGKWYRLAKMHGEIINEDANKLIRVFELEEKYRENPNDLENTYLLAKSYEFSFENSDRRVRLLKELVQKNYTIANYDLAQIFLNYPQFDGYYAKALELLRGAAQAGDINSMMQIAKLLKRYQYDPANPSVVNFDDFYINTLISINSRESLSLLLDEYSKQDNYDKIEKILLNLPVEDQVYFYGYLAYAQLESFPDMIDYKKSLFFAYKQLDALDAEYSKKIGEIDHETEDAYLLITMAKENLYVEKMRAYLSIGYLYISSASNLPRDEDKAIENWQLVIDIFLKIENCSINLDKYVSKPSDFSNTNANKELAWQFVMYLLEVISNAEAMEFTDKMEQKSFEWLKIIAACGNEDAQELLSKKSRLKRD